MTGIAVLFAVFGGVIVGLFALMISLVVRAAKRERLRRQYLWAYAAQQGWRPIPAGAPLPWPVAEAARSRRSQMVLATRLRGFDLWLVWHQWTESSGESTTTHYLTRYFLWPHRPYPNIVLARRTRIGASLMPVRGVGTGDVEFDRRFLVRGTPDVAGLLAPVLRREMLAGNLPTWQIAGGTLITAYHDSPQPENLQYRAEVIAHLANRLA